MRADPSSLYGYSSWPEHYFSWKKCSLYSDIVYYCADFSSLSNDPQTFSKLIDRFSFPVNHASISHIYAKSSRDSVERFQNDMIAKGSKNGRFLDYEGKPLIHITPQPIKDTIRKKAQPYEKILDDLYKKWTSII